MSTQDSLIRKMIKSLPCVLQLIVNIVEFFSRRLIVERTEIRGSGNTGFCVDDASNEAFDSILPTCEEAIILSLHKDCKANLDVCAADQSPCLVWPVRSFGFI